MQTGRAGRQKCWARIYPPNEAIRWHKVRRSTEFENNREDSTFFKVIDPPSGSEITPLHLKVGVRRAASLYIAA
jgi:hypothetical protein